MLKKLLPGSVKRKVKLAALAGDNVYCPCCNRSFITFLPDGIPLRANAQCPSCFSLERHRAIVLFLKQKTSLFSKGGKLLHIAPDKSLFPLFMQNPKIHYFPGDKKMPGYHYSDKVVSMDITDIPFKDEEFDFLICNHVLEHVDDDIRAMSECFRVLKKGGSAILQVPIDYRREETYEDFSIVSPEERLQVFGQRDHVRIYGKDYINRLKSVGFRVEMVDISKEYSNADQFKYGLPAYDPIYYCHKD